MVWADGNDNDFRVDLVSWNAVNIIVISIVIVSARFGVNISVGVDFDLPFFLFQNPPDQTTYFTRLLLILFVCSLLYVVICSCVVFNFFFGRFIKRIFCVLILYVSNINSFHFIETKFVDWHFFFSSSSYSHFFSMQLFVVVPVNIRSILWLSSWWNITFGIINSTNCFYLFFIFFCALKSKCLNYILEELKGTYSSISLHFILLYIVKFHWIANENEPIKMD